MTDRFDLPAGLADRLRGVRSVGVITGAGISAESGIPTYRGRGGIYDDPDEGDRTIEALSAPTLISDPDRTWRALYQIAGAAAGAAPNAAHAAIVEIERRAERFVLLTQNVDGLHRMAGSRNIIDIHGDAFSLLCTGCGRQNRFADPRAPLACADHLCIADEMKRGRAPRCRCGKVYRPEVVLFGEMLPGDKLARLHNEFYANPPELVISVGTSNMFPYIVEPVVVAARAGRLTIEVNPEPTTISDLVDYHLQAAAGAALPAIVEALVSQ
jgi:NAD-dependent deacetylase